MWVSDESKSCFHHSIIISDRASGCFPSKNIATRQVNGTNKFSLGTSCITAYPAKVAKKSWKSKKVMRLMLYPSLLWSGCVYAEDCCRFSDSLNRATSEAQLSLQSRLQKKYIPSSQWRTSNKSSEKNVFLHWMHGSFIMAIPPSSFIEYWLV